MLAKALYLIPILIIVHFSYQWMRYIPTFYNYMSSQPQQRTQILQQLIFAPYFGQLFYQQLIQNYVDDNQWKNVLQYTKKAIKSPANRNNFAIWYYRAWAQCIFQNVTACQRSYKISTSLSSPQQEYHFHDLAKFIFLLKKNNNRQQFNKSSNPSIQSNDEKIDSDHKQPLIQNKQHYQSEYVQHHQNIIYGVKSMKLSQL